MAYTYEPIRDDLRQAVLRILDTPQHIGEINPVSSTEIPRKEPHEDVFEVRPSSESSNLSPSYRAFDHGDVTRRVCLTGLIVIWIAIATCFGVIVALFVQTSNFLTFSGFGNAIEPGGSSRSVAFTTGFLYGGELHVALTDVLFPLLVIGSVMLCNECMGYIHATTLRWALREEGRLHSNTKLRLLSNSKSSIPNSWYMNLLFFICMAAVYTGAGQLFASFDNSRYPTTDGDFDDMTSAAHPHFFVINGIPLIAICAGLLGQAIITTWAFYSSRKSIRTWSSNSVNNTLCLLQLDLPMGLRRYNNRSMASYAGPTRSVEDIPPRRPKSRCSSLWTARRSSRLTVWWLLVTLVATLTCATILYTERDVSTWKTTNPSRFFLHSGPSNDIRLGGPGDSWSSTGSRCMALLLAFGLQQYLTLGLHCAELLVNIRRDEKLWRKAADRNGGGTEIDSNSVKAAVKSWETVLLIAFKLSIHWIYGESVLVTTEINDDGLTGRFQPVITFYARGLFVLAAVLGLLVLFGLYLTLHRPSGYQPTAWGNFQTLANLIDEWGSDGDAIFWGDKGLIGYEYPGVRRAGTSPKPDDLGEIRKNDLYL